MDLFEQLIQWFKLLKPYKADIIIISQVFIAIFLSLIAKFIQAKIFKHLQKKTSTTSTIWDDAVVYAVNKPLGYMIWLFGITFAALILEQEINNKAIFAWIEPGRSVGAIVLIAWMLVRFLNRAEYNLTDPQQNEKPVDKTTASVISRLLRVSVLITTILITLQSLNIPIGGFLALGSAGTFIIGFASKDLLANFFGGIMVFMDRPFQVGDWICSPEKNIEGIVEEIGWRTTRIRRFDKRPLYVPNSLFTTISLENPSRMLNRHIKVIIGLRYSDIAKVPTVSMAIEEMLKNHPEIDATQTTFVSMNNFSESTLDLLVYCFTKTTVFLKFVKIKEEILVKIYEIVKANGADMAFPTRTLDVDPGLIAATAAVKSS